MFEFLNFSKCYKINLNRGGSYTDCPGKIKNKEATTNRVNNVKSFQYAATDCCSKEIGKHLQKILKINPLMRGGNKKVTRT